MRNKIFTVFVLTALLLVNCKKQSVKEEVGPEPVLTEYYPNGTPKFLKEVKVAGAEKIHFDSLTKNFTIKLPENFSADDITLALSMYSGIKLLDSTLSATNLTNIKFSFKGSEPLRFALGEPKGAKKYYNVYVQAQGQPHIELLTKEIPLNNGPIRLPLKIISGLGTTPSLPGEGYATVKITNLGASLVINGSFYHKQVHANIADAEKLIASDGLSMSINFGTGKNIRFEDIRFKRGLPRAVLASFDNILIPKTDSLTASGGYFTSAENYQARFFSDFLSNPVAMKMTFIDSFRLSGMLPKDIPDGSYLVTFYENEKIIGKNSLYLSSSKTHSIETIWQGEPSQALSRNTEKILLKKGDTFYAKPWPVSYVPGSAAVSAFNEKDLPLLRLKTGSITSELKPQLAVVNWAVAGFSFAIGKYTVPANFQAGSYEAILVFPDNQESKPYWSKIEIR